MVARAICIVIAAMAVIVGIIVSIYYSSQAYYNSRNKPNEFGYGMLLAFLLSSVALVCIKINQYFCEEPANSQDAKDAKDTKNPANFNGKKMIIMTP